MKLKHQLNICTWSSVSLTTLVATPAAIAVRLFTAFAVSLAGLTSGFDSAFTSGAAGAALVLGSCSDLAGFSGLADFSRSTVTGISKSCPKILRPFVASKIWFNMPLNVFSRIKILNYLPGREMLTKICIIFSLVQKAIFFQLVTVGFYTPTFCSYFNWSNAWKTEGLWLVFFTAL